MRPSKASIWAKRTIYTMNISTVNAKKNQLLLLFSPFATAGWRFFILGSLLASGLVLCYCKFNFSSLPNRTIMHSSTDHNLV